MDDLEDNFFLSMGKGPFFSVVLSLKLASLKEPSSSIEPLSLTDVLLLMDELSLLAADFNRDLEDIAEEYLPEGCTRLAEPFEEAAVAAGVVGVLLDGKRSFLRGLGVDMGLLGCPDCHGLLASKLLSWSLKEAGLPPLDGEG